MVVDVRFKERHNSEDQGPNNNVTPRVSVREERVEDVHVENAGAEADFPYARPKHDPWAN